MFAELAFPPVSSHLDDEIVDAMTMSLPGFAMISFTKSATLFEFTFEADSVSQAANEALAAAENSWKLAGRTGVPTALRVVTDDERMREIAHPVPIDLVGITGIADKFGVSKSRASEIVELESFPAPIGMTSAGRVWSADSVRSFSSQWKRRPGRPIRNETD